MAKADLTKKIQKDPNGDIFIPNIPMVDQGDKGYCAVATASRVLNYYGIPADHENNIYLLEFSSQNIGRIDAKTKLEVRRCGPSGPPLRHRAAADPVGKSRSADHAKLAPPAVRRFR